MVYVPPAVVRFTAATGVAQVKLLVLWYEAAEEVGPVKDTYNRYSRTVIVFLRKLKEDGITVKNDAPTITPSEEPEST